MRVRRYQASDQAAWDDFVQRSKNGTFLFLRGYMDYHQDRFTDHSLLVYDEKDQLLALFPANETAERISSHGGLTYGGFISDEAMKTPKMLDAMSAAWAYYASHGFTELDYKTIPHIYHRVPAEEDRYALFQNGARWRGCSVITAVDQRERLAMQGRRKRGIKKAQKQQVSIRQSDNFPAYWDLLSGVLASTYDAQPVHRLDEISVLQARFPQHIKLYTAQHQGDMVAGVLVYESARVARAQYIAADERGKSLGALDLLFHELLHTIYPDKPYFEFGTSEVPGSHDLQMGLIDQKEGFGARAVVQDRYWLDLKAWKAR